MPSPNAPHISENIWINTLKHLSGRQLAQAYGTSITIQRAIKSSEVLLKRWRNARNLHHKANINVYANLTRLRNKLNNASPAKRKNIQNQIRLILNEQSRRRVRNMRKLLTPNALKRWNAR